MLAGLALDLLDASEHARHAAELGDEARGALFPDALDAGDVVRGVAHDGQHIDHMAGIGAELLLDFRDALDHEIGLGFEEVVELDALAYELHQVLVASDQHDFATRGFGLAGQGADHIVGLETGALEDRDAVGPHHLADVIELRDEVLGHALAGGLVLFELLMAKSRSRRVEGHSHQIRFFGAQDAPQTHGEAVGGSRGQPFGGGQSRARHGEVGAVANSSSVEQKDACHGRQGSASSGWPSIGATSLLARMMRETRIGLPRIVFSRFPTTRAAC